VTKVLRDAARASGAGLLPMMGTYAVTSCVAGPLYARLGPNLMVSLGAAVLAVGIFGLSLVHPSPAYDGLMTGMMVVGIGVGLFSSSITTAAVTALDPSRSSLAGGSISRYQIAGGSIGLGVITALMVTAGSLVEGIHRVFLVDACSPSAGWWSPSSSSAGTSTRNACAQGNTTTVRTRLEPKSIPRERIIGVSGSAA
jgi:hypothetical protein